MPHLLLEPVDWCSLLQHEGRVCMPRLHEGPIRNFGLFDQPGKSKMYFCSGVDIIQRRSGSSLIIYDACRKLVRMKRIRLPGGDLEYAVLAKLWDLGTASARDIHSFVGEPAGLVYTTTAKVLDRLHEKGLVTRERKGKAFSYRAKIARDVVDHARARTVLSRLLGARPHTAVAALVEAVESIDPQLLGELERAVAARRRSKHGT